MLLIACYGYAFSFARGEGAEEAASFSGPLKWLDFGSGQERGIRGAARERYFDSLKEEEQSSDGSAGREAAAAGVGSDGKDA